MDQRHRKCIASQDAYFEKNGRGDVNLNFDVRHIAVHGNSQSHMLIFFIEILNTVQSDIKIYTSKFTDESNNLCSFLYVCPRTSG